MVNFLKKIKPSLFLLVVVLLGYWQVAFFTQALKWDLIDVVFPFRFYFSECIQSGYFPFWNPYQQTGTPFYADLQAPTFYPELLYTSLFTGYSIYVMHILFMLYLFLAARGMYGLSLHFNKNHLASLLAGMSYALSGFITAHGQHFFLLVGAAWIPFVILHFLKLQEKRNFIQALKTAVFVFLMISGAYQALSFTLFYLLILLFFYFIVKETAQRNFRVVWETIRANLWLLLIVIAFSLPLIVSTLEIIPSVNRLASGISLAQSTGLGQSFKSVISFILPNSTLKYDEFFGVADVALRNHYFGFIPFLLFLAALFHKRSVPEYLILGYGLVIFAMSFSFLPVRELLFKYVPFMNLFLSAAYIRIFGLFAFILLAANYFAYFQKNYEKEKNKIFALGIFFLLMLIALVFYALTKVSAQEFSALKEYRNLADKLLSMSFYQHVFFQSVFQIIICIAFLSIIFRYVRLKRASLLVVILVAAETIVATQLNMSATVTDALHKPFRMKKDLALYPGKFPIPTDSKIIFNDQQHALFSPFWRNTSIFSKQVSFDSFSSFKLDSYSRLDGDFPNLRNAVLNNHLFYFSDTILPLKQFDDKKVDVEKDAKVLYLSGEDFEILSKKPAKADNSDEIVITEFSPTKVVATATTKNSQFLTMLQTHFKGWKAYIDHSETPVYTSNFNYRTIYLPKGKHVIRFKYENQKILVPYIISNALFLLALLFLIGYAVRKYKFRDGIFIFIPLAVFLVISFFALKRLSARNENLTLHEILAQHQEKKNSLFHLFQDFENEPLPNDSIAFSGEKSMKIHTEDDFFDMVRISCNDLKIKSGTLIVKAKIYPEDYCSALIVSEVRTGNIQSGWHAAKLEKEIEKLHKWNEIVYFRNFYDLKEEEEIVVYLWNPNRETFRLDDIKIDFYQLF